MLLDTHILIWFCTGSKRLKAATKRRILDEPTVYVSPISLVEIAIKSRLGKLGVTPEEIKEKCDIAGFEELALRFTHSLALATLPPHHNDPFDRMLVAQAGAERMLLITSDKLLAAYGACVEIV